jgi:DNA-binding GntR family transcriptional regulator
MAVWSQTSRSVRSSSRARWGSAVRRSGRRCACSTVKSYTAADLEDVYNLRAALEGYAAQTAAEHITRELVRELEQSCTRYARLRARAEDLPKLAEENLIFHDTILKAAGSVRLSAMIRQVTALPLIYKSYLTYSPGNRRSAERHHRAITAALKARDGKAARELLESHVLWARDLAIAHLPLIGEGTAPARQPG